MSDSSRRRGKRAAGNTDAPPAIGASAGHEHAMPLPQRVVLWSIALAVLGSAWLFDPAANAAFDAPKRLVVLIAAAFGTAALVWSAVPAWPRWSRPAQAIVVLAALAALGLGVSTSLSPHPLLAWEALRTMALFALFVPLGASDAMRGAGGRRVLQIAIAAVALNALLSLLQTAGVTPLQIVQLGGRLPGVGLLGNEGYVALACALSTVACCVVALHAGTRRLRGLTVALAVLGIATMLANRQLTATIALAAGLVMIAAVRWRLHWLPATGAALLAIVALTASIAPLRAVTWAAVPGGDVERYQQLTTYRLGAWVAAADMVGERPLTGFGPGSFVAEGQARRFAAEARLRQRLALPETSSTFVNPHQEYLQLAAEGGVPVLLAVLAALALLFASLLRLAATTRAAEPLLLLAVLTSGAVAALAWFPLQIPLTAVLLLLACGRAWRLVADASAAAAEADA